MSLPSTSCPRDHEHSPHVVHAKLGASGVGCMLVWGFKSCTTLTRVFAIIEMLLASRQLLGCLALLFAGSPHPPHALHTDTHTYIHHREESVGSLYHSALSLHGGPQQPKTVNTTATPQPPLSIRRPPFASLHQHGSPRSPSQAKPVSSSSTATTRKTTPHRGSLGHAATRRLCK